MPDPSNPDNLISMPSYTIRVSPYFEHPDTGNLLTFVGMPVIFTLEFTQAVDGQVGDPRSEVAIQRMSEDGLSYFRYVSPVARVLTRWGSGGGGRGGSMYTRETGNGTVCCGACVVSRLWV